MGTRVVLIGCGDLRTPKCGCPVERLAPTRIYTEPLAGARAVVLGASAIEQLDVDRAWKVIVSVRSRTIVCADSCAGPALAAWLLKGLRTVVPTASLAGHLVRMRDSVVRPAVPRQEWTTSAASAGSPADAIASVIETSERLRVDECSAGLDWSADRLHGECVAAFGLPAKQVILCYIAAVYRELRARGDTNESAAAALGYFDAPTLLRAVARGNRARLRAADILNSAKVRT